MNALDGQDEERRTAEARTQIANLDSIGLTAEDLDLRTLNPVTVRQAFGDPDFVWVRGGNVFTLRMAMARSGIDQVLTEYTRQDRLVYAWVQRRTVRPRPQPGWTGTLRLHRSLHRCIRRRSI